MNHEEPGELQALNTVKAIAQVVNTNHFHRNYFAEPLTSDQIQVDRENGAIIEITTAVDKAQNHACFKNDIKRIGYILLQLLINQVKTTAEIEDLMTTRYAEYIEAERCDLFINKLVADNLIPDKNWVSNETKCLLTMMLDC